MSDWQEAAFATRHLHNRASKSKAGGGRGRRGGAFEVRRTLGRYDVKCPSASRVSPPPESGGKKGKRTAAAAAAATRPTLDIFRLSDDGRGLLGELVLPGALEASVILTGSRKTLEDLILKKERKKEKKDKGKEEKKEKEKEEKKNVGTIGKMMGYAMEDMATLSPTNGGDTSGHEESDDDDPDKERSRFRAFEKNSFRSPKFWFQWKGRTTAPSPPPPGGRGLAAGRAETGRGYVVFSGNDCRSFKGTITCDALGWKDASMSGWKEVSMSERDVAFAWS
ncbi:catalase [Colletotrichum higginsianum]|nr:catalase [Colletotrichum higginsianum]